MDGIEGARSPPLQVTSSLRCPKWTLLKLNALPSGYGEACAYLTDDHGVAPQDGREARNRGRLETGPVEAVVALMGEPTRASRERTQLTYLVARCSDSVEAFPAGAMR
jgi:hypothetical protein